MSAAAAAANSSSSSPAICHHCSTIEKSVDANKRTQINRKSMPLLFSAGMLYKAGKQLFRESNGMLCLSLLLSSFLVGIEERERERICFVKKCNIMQQRSSFRARKLERGRRIAARVQIYYAAMSIIYTSCW